MINDRIIIRYELGDYWIEYSYSSSISDDKLSFLMEIDKIKFLKDLSKELSKNKSSPKKLDNLLVDHEIFSGDAT